MLPQVLGGFALLGAVVSRAEAWAVIQLSLLARGVTSPWASLFPSKKWVQHQVGRVAGFREGEWLHGWPWTLLVLTPEMSSLAVWSSSGERLFQAWGAPGLS